MLKSIALLGIPFAAIFVLINGIYAFRRPGDFLKSK
jgi:hypothetical protein